MSFLLRAETPDIDASPCPTDVEVDERASGLAPPAEARLI
jgi:hypothetical protein